MERIEALISKLKEQFEQKADPTLCWELFSYYSLN